jgi:hypothetical protein
MTNTRKGSRQMTSSTKRMAELVSFVQIRQCAQVSILSFPQRQSTAKTHPNEAWTTVGAERWWNRAQSMFAGDDVPEGLRGGILRDDEEAPAAKAPEALAGPEAIAAAIAHHASSQNPEVAPVSSAPR